MNRPREQQIEPSVKERTDRWFTQRGVPTFADSYPFRKLLPVLLAWMLVVAMVQLGSTSLLDLETWHVAIGPVVVILLALPLLPALRWALDPGRPENRPAMSGSRLLLAFVTAAILLLLLTSTEDDGQSLLEAVVNGVVLVIAAVVAWLVGVHRQARPEVENRPSHRHWVPLAVGVAAVVLFALENMPVEPLDQPTLGMLPAGVPAALPVFVFLLPLWLFARWMKQAGPAYDPRRVADCGRRDALISLSPILVFALGPETALLPTVDERWVEALVPLVVLIALVLLALWRPQWSWYRTAPTLSWLPRTQTRNLWIVAVLVFGAYLVVYPVLASLFDREEFEVAAGINAGYLLAAAVLVALGADRMADWVGRKLRNDHRAMVRDILDGLPLLVVFATFFLFTAELWQAVEEIPGWAFRLLIGAVLLFAFLPLTVLAFTDLRKHRAFRDWKSVGRAALRIDDPKADVLERLDGLKRAPDDAEDRGMEDVVALLDTVRERLVEDERPDGKEKLEVELSLRQWLNIAGIIGLYQALFFVPLFVGAFGVLLGVGLLGVRNDLLDNWVNGDQPADLPPRQAEEFLVGSFFTWPWTKVAFFLAAFSILYISVDILKTGEARRRFFAPADDGVKQRLAVKKVYEEQVPQWKAAAEDLTHSRPLEKVASLRSSN